MTTKNPDLNLTAWVTLKFQPINIGARKPNVHWSILLLAMM